MKTLVYLFAILYLLSPVDLIPELFAGRSGFIDDLIVMAALYYWYCFYRAAKLKAPGGKTGGSGQREKEIPRENRPGIAKDPCEVLGLGKNATAGEIKHAYRELANKYHPDRVSHLGEEFKELAHKRFKEIQAAYEELAPK